MLQENNMSSGGRVSAINSTFLSSQKSASTLHINSALVIYAAVEFTVVAFAAYFASTAYHFVTYNSLQTPNVYIVAAATIAVLVLLNSIGFHNFFSFQRQARHIFLWRGVGSVALAFSAFLTILFFTQSAEAYSRGSLIFQLVCVAGCVVLTRTAFYSWLQSAISSNRIEARRLALIGDASQCTKFAVRLNASGFRTVGSFRLPGQDVFKDATEKGQAIRKITAELRMLRADDVIVLTSNEFMPSIFDFTSSFLELPVGVHIVPVDAPNVLASTQIAEFGSLRTIQVCQPPLSKFDLLIKRVFDVVFATIGLLVLSPLFFIISIAIKLDSPGPVFFRNTRHGFNNDKIRVLKFRSMTTTEDGDQFRQATRDDPRVTRIGRIIRRTNIDELPQLINVVRGEMSLVGPRPHATAHNALYTNVITPFSRRHNVKPGITGWAQVNGCRGATDVLEKMQRRIEYDLYYIDNWTFLFDLKIIMMTLFSKKAYLNAY